MKACWISALALAAAAGAPAAAQDAEVWPIDADSSACTTSRIGSATSDALVVRYDPAAREIMLETAVEDSGPVSRPGTASLWIIFDKGRGEELDIAWGYRQFAVRSDDGRIALSTRFSGTRNIDQILADLGSSRRLGLVLEEKTVADFDLTGIAPALARLKACASQLAAR
ncbi:MAG: hypothetical protein B7Z08_09185 [Sphingomonadales bacterium 32-68-7]|nr:MAG: hypothetical protein B7Z33_11825 [Sphingomonadales bacterium 12-68-11]OYX08470.1 MAG: hypothetical protein B7Z08_09185 [Sphingomonadales bacterium 32-68-7]